MFEAICQYYGVEVGNYPNVNNNTKISTYDNSLSGKQYIMYLAELFGGNAKIQRDGSCSIIPLKNYTNIEINALTSKKFEVGQTYQLTRVCYNNLNKLYAGGNVITVSELPTENIDTNSHYYLTTEMKYYKYNNGWQISNEIKNTLYIRPDNIFISQQSEIDAIYNAVKNFSVTNITCENRMDLSIDSWDIVKYVTDKGEYYTFYDNTINYNAAAMGTINVNIPLKTQEETTNVIENQKVINRRVQATINQIDGSINLLSQEVSENTENIATLELTASGISSRVTNLSNNLSNNYSTTAQMNSAITQKANEISSTVSTKVGKNEIISSINQTSESVKIKANKISLSGTELDLTSDNITISSTYFSVDKYGKITSNGGVQITDTNLWVRGGNIYVRRSTSAQSGSSIDYESVNTTKVNATNIYGTNVYKNNKPVIVNNQQVEAFAFYSSTPYLEVNTTYNGAYGIDIWASDRRLKDNIKDTDVSALDIIDKIQHRQFDWKSNKIHENIGYIAQELEEINEKFVLKIPQRDEEGEIIDERYQINETKIIPYLSKSIQELNDKVNYLFERGV